MPRKMYYKSEKVLGQLYRAIDEGKIWYEDVKSKIRPLSSSFWDEFVLSIRVRYEAIVTDAGEWHSRMETAREIRGWYESAISDAMYQYSEHPVKPISELEVFIGNIFSKTGVQTNRQRDNSKKLRDEFARIASWITSMLRKVRHEAMAPLTGYETLHDSLHLCFACVNAGLEKTSLYGSTFQDLQSFRVVAACALLNELAMHERSGGGGRHPI